MATYTKEQIDLIPGYFNSINKKIELCISEFLNSFDYEILNQLLIEIYNEYKSLKDGLAELLVEIRINILEIEEPKVFDKYQKYCHLRLKSIHKILEPEDIDGKLNTIKSGFISHVKLDNYARFEVPVLLNLYNLSGYLYTYSFMLLVLKKSVLGIIDKLEFQNASEQDFTIFDEQEIRNESTYQFKLSNKKGIRTDLIRILNAIYELKLIEYKDGQFPPKKEFMLKVGEFFGTDLSSYDADLSQSLNNTSLEKNTEIFRKMIDVVEKAHFTSDKDLNNKT